MFKYFSTLILITIFCCSHLCIAQSALPPSNEPGIELAFYPTSTPTTFLLVEKATQQLMLLEQRQASLELLRSFPCATGENPGTKETSGDARTPEGVYFITEVFQDSEITVFGSRAFHLNYPNIFDEYAGHNGDGIFIHGTNTTLYPYSTNGCITLNNVDLEELAPYLTVQTIPIVIVDTLTEDIGGANFSMSYGDPMFNSIMDAIGLSDAEIKPEQIEKLQFFKVGAQAMAWIRYSEYDDNFMQYKYDKQVFFKPIHSTDWRILYASHKQDKILSLLAVHPTKHRIIKAIPQTPPPKPSQLAIAKGTELLDFVERWRKSWSSKDIDTYMQCYSRDFHSGGLGKKDWRKKKTYLNRKYEYIQISIDNIIVERTSEEAKISFFQKYESDLYQTSGKKTLQLVMEDGQWRIRKEYM